jgi:type IV pilus assembly protein PilB
MALRIGEMLLKAGLITEKDLEEALKRQKETGKRLGSTLVEMGVIDEKTLVKFLAKQLGVPPVDLSTLKTIPEDVLSLVPPETAYRYQVLPLARKGNVLFLAMVDPTNIIAIDEIRFSTGLEISPAIALESALNEALRKFYPQMETIIKEVKREEEKDEIKVAVEDFEFIEGEIEEEKVEDLKKLGEDTTITKIVNHIIFQAVKIGASDIHIEPYERTLRIRYRIDGVLQEVMNPPYHMKAGIVSRIKLLSDMDIAERRKPQDGRINMRIDNRVIDFRVSVIPTVYGEKVVMRILDKSGLQLDLTKLGFEEEDLKKFEKAIRSPYGIILVTGPTGSGKTTTLYSALSTINTPDRQIITVEDPVEYNIEGINQVQVNREVGLDFAEALRAFLRQSPDVILVGEIRDHETAEIAIRAALTGHLVFSTIHTNDAPTTIDRLVDLGIKPYLIASGVILIQAQRLVRKICRNCIEETTYDEKIIKELGVPDELLKDIKFYKGRGCEKCGRTGYKGRIGIFEVMPITPSLRELILKGASSDEIREKAREEGMHTLREDGIIKIKKGITTVEEVLRITTEF